MVDLDTDESGGLCLTQESANVPSGQVERPANLILRRVLLVIEFRSPDR